MKDFSVAFVVVLAMPGLPAATTATAAGAPGSAAAPVVEPISLARTHADPPLAG